MHVRNTCTWRASPTSTVFALAFVVAVSSSRSSGVPTIPASTMTRLSAFNFIAPERKSVSVFATVYPASPTSTRTATSTALPVGAPERDAGRLAWLRRAAL